MNAESPWVRFVPWVTKIKYHIPQVEKRQGNNLKLVIKDQFLVISIYSILGWRGDKKLNGNNVLSS